MQYGNFFSALLVGVLAGIQACNAQSYRISAQPQGTVNTVYTMASYVNSANGGAYIGNVKLQQSAEPLVLTIGGTPSIARFLTYHSDRYQELSLYDKEVKPVLFTLWQSVPAGVQTSNFTVSGGFLRYQGEERWALCPSSAYAQSYQIFYLGSTTAGAGILPPGCIGTRLSAQEYGVCSGSTY